MDERTCPHCSQFVAPKRDNSCPSCGFDVSRNLTVAEQEQHRLSQTEDRAAVQNEIAGIEFGWGCFLISVTTAVSLISIGVAAAPDSLTNGIWFIFWGPGIAGILLMIRSLIRSIGKR